MDEIDIRRLSQPFQEFTRRAEEIARAHGATNPTALAQMVVHLVMQELSGGVHIPDPATYERLIRDAQIRQLHTGANTAELAARFSLTPRQVRKILNRY